MPIFQQYRQSSTFVLWPPFPSQALPCQLRGCKLPTTIISLFSHAFSFSARAWAFDHNIPIPVTRTPAPPPRIRLEVYIVGHPADKLQPWVTHRSTCCSVTIPLLLVSTQIFLRVGSKWKLWSTIFIKMYFLLLRVWISVGHRSQKVPTRTRWHHMLQVS